MNKSIINQDIEGILFFDIETVSSKKDLDANSKEFERYAWSIRDKSTGFIPPNLEVKKHYSKNAALKPQFNKIVVISVGFIKDRILYCKSLLGNQKEIVSQFYNLVSTTGFKVCGHNVVGFDLPNIRIKCFQEKLDPRIIPDRIMDSGKKPWNLEEFILDTMKIITGTYYSSISLDDACMLRGIQSSKDDISGAYVTETYYREGVDGIARYCEKDVVATAKLFCALQGKENYIQEVVFRGAEELKENKPVNILEHILASGELSNDIVQEIVRFTNDNKLNKENVIILVRAALSKTKKYQKVEEEDLHDLKEALGLLVDYSKIQCVVDKKNLGKKQAEILIGIYKEASEEERQDISSLAEKYLIDHGKINQERAKNALSYLKEKLL